MSNISAYKLLAKMGYTARGVIYVTIGALAMLSFKGLNNDEPSSRGAILSIKSQPFGEVLLIALASGLIGYVVWRLIQALSDADGHGHDVKGLSIRFGLFISAITHSALCYLIISLLLREQKSSSEQSTTASILNEFFSAEIQVWIFIGIGVVVFGVGVAHLVKSMKSGFQSYMKLPSSQRFWMKPLCQFGLFARGIVWCIVGWIFAHSAIEAGSSSKKGMEEAFAWLHNSPFGNWLVLIVAIGLFAFGLYSCLEALYRRVEK